MATVAMMVTAVCLTVSRFDVHAILQQMRDDRHAVDRRLREIEEKLDICVLGETVAAREQRLREPEDLP
jgi:hypothetical protein